jgi:non-heme chloroperoxidase
MKPVTKYVELPNHVRIPYLEKGDPTGVPLILLHGIADSCHTFELLLPCLPECIHTFAFTQRGHGDASRPESGYRTSDFEADLVMFMDILHIEKAVIAGASSGGFTARRFAINHPERTLGLVLLGSPSTLRDNPSVQASVESAISKLTDPVDPEFVRGFIKSTIFRPVPKVFFEMIIKQHFKVPARVWKETSEGLFEEEFPGEINRIKSPALIIWGDQDTILPKSGQEALSKAIEHSRLVVYPGAGHMLYWDEPGRVASDLAAFIKEISN